MDESLFYYMGLVPLLGVLAQWLAWRLKVPSILLLLLAGILLGQFVEIDKILQDVAHSESADAAAHLLFPFISLSVAVILFEGGLSLRLSELKEAGTPVFRLVTLGVLISWALTSLAVSWILELNIRLAILLGAILVVTGPTVVAPLLRNIRPLPKVGSILKWEGIVVDPIGAVLAVLVFEELLVSATEDGHLWGAIAILGGTLLIGLVIGSLTAVALTYLLSRYWVPDYLHGVLILATALATFAISNGMMHESGLVTVTMLGIFLANQKMVAINHIVEFKEHLGVFLISCLFVVLGSRLNLQAIYALGWDGLLFLGLLVLVIRPLSVFLSLLWTDTSWKERLFFGFLAPRGIVAAAVTSVFALKIITQSADNPEMLPFIDQARQLVPITFLVIIGTVGVYGLSASHLARLLGLSDADPQGVLIAGGQPWVRELAALLEKHGVATVVVDTNYHNVAAARMSGLRAYCGSILSDKIREEADLNGIGRLLSMTGNDEVNLLACREYIHMFGRAGVFQLPLNPKSAGSRSKKLEHMPGRVLFDGTLSFRTIQQMLESGFEIKATTLSEEFGYERFQQRYGINAKLMFVIGESRLKIATTEGTLSPVARQTVIALVPKAANGDKPNGDKPNGDQTNGDKGQGKKIDDDTEKRPSSTNPEPSPGNGRSTDPSPPE